MKLLKISLLALSLYSFSAVTATAALLENNNVAYESDHSAIARILNTSLQWVDDMVVDRQGTGSNKGPLVDKKKIILGSNMTTLGLHKDVKNSECYLVSPVTGLTETMCTDSSINLENYVAKNSTNVPVPQHAEITADWSKNSTDIGGRENVLGDNVIISVNTEDKIITVPVMEANDEALLYYGATLVHAGSNVIFPNDSYPIWKMELGKYYVDNYLMTEQGKGFYLEYHHDRPHWHQPLTADADGFYLLAKEAGVNAEGQTVYHLSGFRIPHGEAVYTRMGAIHADPALSGSVWAVGYSDSGNYSTALVRNSSGEMIRFIAQ